MSTALTASERLVLSREKFKQALSHQPAPVPPAASAANALAQWWTAHPLHEATAGVAIIANAALLPLAQRHPVRLVAGGLLVGGLLAWSRPWQWLPKAALIDVLLPKFACSVLAQTPAASWMAILSALASVSTEK